MNNRIKIIFDTSALIAFFLTSNKSYIKDIFKKIENGEIISYISQEIVFELNVTLNKSYIFKLLNKGNKVPDIILQNYLEMCEKVKSDTQEILGCRDKTDDKFLSLALMVQADCIITLDKDLLDMHPFENIDIMKPHSFLQKYYNILS